MSLGEKNKVSKFILCNFMVVVKHYESVMVLKLSHMTTDEALMKKQFCITLIWRYMSSVRSTQSQGVNTFSDQFVLRQGAEGCIHY